MVKFFLKKTIRLLLFQGFLIFSFFLCSLCLSVEVDAATYYVAGDTGSDSNDGSQSTPWKTIQKAADTMVAGDTVNVKGGITYTGDNNCPSLGGTRHAVVCINTSGATGNYITYQAWPGTGIPVIDSTAPRSGSGFNGSVFAGTSYIVIDGFEITDSTQATSDHYDNAAGINFELATLHHLTIKNNLIHHHSNGIDLMGALGGGSSIKVYNNTVYANEGYGLDICINPGGVIMYNNISVGNGEGFYADATPYTADYNLIWGNTDNYTEAAVAGAHDVSLDPLFTDAANNNFRLSASSPAKNVGTTLSDVTADILGVARPQGLAYDIGAYEYYDIPVTLTSSDLGYINYAQPSFTGTASTITGAALSSVSYSLDSGSWTTSGVIGTDSFTINLPSALSNGTHSVRVRATDSYTNTTDSSLYGTDSFTVDTASPNASWTNTEGASRTFQTNFPADKIFTTSNLPSFTFTKSSDAINLSKYQILIKSAVVQALYQDYTVYIDDIPADCSSGTIRDETNRYLSCTGDEIFTYSKRILDQLADGGYKWKARAIDQAGNSTDTKERVLLINSHEAVFSQPFFPLVLLTPKESPGGTTSGTRTTWTSTPTFFGITFANAEVTLKIQKENQDRSRQTLLEKTTFANPESRFGINVEKTEKLPPGEYFVNLFAISDAGDFIEIPEFILKVRGTSEPIVAGAADVSPDPVTNPTSSFAPRPTPTREPISTSASIPETTNFPSRLIDFLKRLF